MPSFHHDLAAQPVPRYTSYPTAAQFHPGIGAADQAAALAAVPAGAPVSLYLHIPFCRQICWYCGCNTGLAAPDRMRRYVKALKAEIATVGAAMRGHVGAVSFGGGSPNALEPRALAGIIAALRAAFAITPDAEIAMELDPRAITPDLAPQLAAAGVNRISLGVQTFAPHVQAAINRIQPPDMIERAVADFRAAGIQSINFDLMFGLPGQSAIDLDESITRAIALRPDRVAMFAYAHLPGAIPRQRMIRDADLPGAAARFAMGSLAHRRFTAAGWQAIGFDHFALPEDRLAVAARTGRLHRNFQGYATDPGMALIGLGATAISQFPGLIVQNEKHLATWEAAVSAGALAGARGVLVAADDARRGAVIERLLCDGAVEVPADMLDGARPALAPLLARGVAGLAGQEVRITPDGWPYARLVAAAFDAHLKAPERHARAV